jgi:hypothetical protein
MLTDVYRDEEFVPTAVRSVLRKHEEGLTREVNFAKLLTLISSPDNQRSVPIVYTHIYIHAHTYTYIHIPTPKYIHIHTHTHTHN